MELWLSLALMATLLAVAGSNVWMFTVMRRIINHQDTMIQDLLDRLMAKIPAEYFAIRAASEAEEKERPPVKMRYPDERVGPVVS